MKYKKIVTEMIKSQIKKTILIENTLINDFITTIRQHGIKILHDSGGQKIMISGTSYKNVTNTLDKFNIDAKVEKVSDKIIVDYSKNDY